MSGNMDIVVKNNEPDSNFELRTIKSLKNYIFLVEDYQRGYKWDERQVLDLLRDIDEFEPRTQTQQFYCLQPVAVKQIEEEKLAELINEENLHNENFDAVFELVDGQQRLTTTFLILRLFNTFKNYHRIIYRTRPQSKLYLNSINDVPADKTIKTNIEYDDLVKSLNKSWESYISQNKEFDNVDNYHFYKAAQIVHNYDYINRDSFIDKLFVSTQIIWYNEIYKSTSRLFADLNSGKIKLTAAELIKALFILDLSPDKSGKNAEVSQFEINELASEWDEIEYQLQQSSFWNFIKGTTKREYTSRIGYLFDVLYDATNEKDDLFTYRLYAEKKESLNWDELKSFFNKLVEWYSEPYIYHRVGFLLFQNNNKLNTLKKIKDISSKCTKAEFKEALDKEIKNAFQKTKQIEKVETQLYHIDNLQYKGHFKLTVTHVLILFNIRIYENLLKDYKINFGEFYNQNWTLEHIFPQNMAAIEEINEAKALLEDYGEIIGNEVDLRSKYDDIIQRLSGSNQKQFEQMKDEIQNFINSISEKFDLHHIGNLTLLHQSENSAIGNKPFKEKRREIINFSQTSSSRDYKTRIIPLGTLNVFTKFYTSDPENLQFSYWSQYDAERYIDAIKDTLKSYLPE